MNRSYNHLSDNFGMPLPKLIIVTGETGSCKSMVVELLEQGIRQQRLIGHCAVFGNREVPWDSETVLKALQDCNNRAVIVEAQATRGFVFPHSPLHGITPLIHLACENGINVGIYTSSDIAPAMGACLAHKSVEFVRVFPELSQELRKSLREDINNRYS